jgi:beta-galactosidase
VEVWVNGASAGRKPAGAAAQNKVSFEVTYQPGTIEAVSYTAGQESGRTHLQTTGQASHLHLTADRPALQAAFGDLAYVTVELQDEQGRRVPCAEDPVTLEVSGAGDLLAIGTANPASEELYVGSQRRAWQGRLMAVVRTTGQPGPITLTARVDGLPDAAIELQAQ